jgi:hypothetical protein
MPAGAAKEEELVDESKRAIHGHLLLHAPRIEAPFRFQSAYAE